MGRKSILPIKEIVAEYLETSATSYTIAKKYGVTSPTISNILAANIEPIKYQKLKTAKLSRGVLQLRQTQYLTQHGLISS